MKDITIEIKDRHIFYFILFSAYAISPFFGRFDILVMASGFLYLGSILKENKKG